MAITKVLEPEALTFLHQKLIYQASSTNVANTGFRFVFEVTVGGDTHTFIVPPNMSNQAVFDIRPVIEGYFTDVIYDATINQGNIHTLGVSDAFLHLYQNPATSTYTRTIDVVIKEGWIIAGVFTPTAVGQATDSCVVFNSRYEELQTLQGGGTRWFGMGMTFLFNKILSNRVPTTNPFGMELATTYGLTGASVKIPVHANSSGVIAATLDNGTNLTADGPIAKVAMVLYEEDGTPNSATYSLTSAAGRFVFFGCYPFNLDNTSYVGLPVPSSFPNYRFYSIAFQDAGNNQIGPQYIFYPMENYDTGTDCYTGLPYLQLAWVNSFGTWDYYTFTRPWTIRYEIGRKRAREVQGNYATAGGVIFTYDIADRGLRDYHVDTEVMVNIETDWLSDGEYKLLSTMVRSRAVHIIGPAAENIGGAGSYGGYLSDIPVVVDDTNFEELRTYPTNLRKANFTFRTANKPW